MIKEIHMKNEATYGEGPVKLFGLEKVNFIYGSNGTGKTTISRVVADTSSHKEGEGKYRECSVKWQGEALEALVYNRDFVEEQFGQPAGLSGVFTLGDADKNILDRIEGLEREKREIQDRIDGWKEKIGDHGSSRGITHELEKNDKWFREKCWALKDKHAKTFSGVFSGYHKSKEKLMQRALDEAEKNTAEPVPLGELEENAETIFSSSHEKEEFFTVPEWDGLIAHEDNPILRKKIIGKSDVDIAKLIQTLNNSDWVKAGREFYAKSKPICPFCQERRDESLEEKFAEYFDESFEKDTSAIRELINSYTDDVDRVRQPLDSLLENPSKRFDAQEVQAQCDLFNSKVQANIAKLDAKLREPSAPMELDSLQNTASQISQMIGAANAAVERHNKTVADLDGEKSMLIDKVWRYFLDKEIKADLVAYKREKSHLESAKSSIQKKILEAESDLAEKKQSIQGLEKSTTSIQPTIDGINRILKSFGFSSFKLAKAGDRLYKIERLNGDDARETLSEGERGFLMFLYFYYRLKGSALETGTTPARVVVFDDPVSSLDSDILFIVSQMVKKTFEEVRSGDSAIKQVFVLTHNVYFHKEVSFNMTRSQDAKLKDETFWIVRKSADESKVEYHSKNPVKTSYELLWSEIRNADTNSATIQNTIRRVLEYYFAILGGFNLTKISEEFQGTEKMICGALLPWAHDGSHSADEDLYVTVDPSMVDRYLRVFQKIFEVTGHLRHYEMMMRGASTESSGNLPSGDSV